MANVPYTKFLGLEVEDTFNLE